MINIILDGSVLAGAVEFCSVEEEARGSRLSVTAASSSVEESESIGIISIGR